MRIYIDLDTGNMIEGPTIYNTISSLSFKRGPVIGIAVSFVKDNVVVELDATGPAATGIFGIKVVGEYESNYVLSASEWVKTGSGQTTVYTFSLSTNTDPLNALLGITGAVTDAIENANVTLMGELLWAATNYPSGATPQFVALVANNINQGFEGMITDGDPTYYKTVESDARYPKIANNGSDFADLLTTLQNLWVAATTAVGGFLYMGAASTLQALAPNATSTLKVLTMTSGVPSWQVPSGGGGGTITDSDMAYVDASGNDGTAAVGNPALPYATAQAAYNALSGGGLLKLGVGTGWMITLTADWNTNVAVSGAGYGQTTLTITGDGASGSPGVPGYNINIASDQTVALAISVDGGNGATDPDNGGAAGNVTLSNCVIASLSSVGGGDDGSSSATGIPGNGGMVTLNNCLVLAGGTVTNGSGYTEGSGLPSGTYGLLQLRQCNVMGTITLPASPGDNSGYFYADLSYIYTLSFTNVTQGANLNNCTYGTITGASPTLNNCNVGSW